MAELTIEGDSFTIEIEGDNSKPALVLSNSLGTTLALWGAQMPALRENFQVVRYEQPRSGQARSGQARTGKSAELQTKATHSSPSKQPTKHRATKSPPPDRRKTPTSSRHPKGRGKS